MLRQIRPTVPQIWSTMRGQSLGISRKFATPRTMLTTSVRHYGEDCGDVKECNNEVSTRGHYFPKDQALCPQWLKALRVKDWTPQWWSKIFSPHFKLTDYVEVNRVGFFRKRNILEKSAVPSIFPWNFNKLQKQKPAVHLKDLIFQYNNQFKISHPLTLGVLAPPNDRMIAISSNLFMNKLPSKVKIVKLTSRIQHGEGPYWDLESNALVYTDTFKATLYKLKTDKDPPISPDCFKLPNHDSVGFALRIKGKKDTWVVCGDRYMYELKWPDKGKVTLKQIHMIEKDKPKNQFNDGKADTLGRIWGGTLKRETDLSVPDFGGSLYMIDQNLKEREILPKISISNGLAWSKDNKKFYYIDSATRDIDEYHFNSEEATICNKKVVFNIKEHGYPGIADGMTIDENDHLWIAMFGGHEVIQVNPACGKIMRKIKLPATYVTSVVWGGPNYDILYATTSHLHLDEKQMKEEPDAGSVFAIHGLGVKGFPSNEVVIKC